MNEQHPEFLDVSSLLSGNKAVMDYLIRRNTLLIQQSWNPSTSTPGHGSAESNIETEKSNSTDVKGQEDPSSTGIILDLSTLALRESTVKKEDVVKFQCPYCNHASCYPEVLWIHQRIAHKVECSRSAPPKWAPCTYTLESSMAGTGPGRRTGPPLFLEGKDCPPLSAPKSQRTQPPYIPAHSNSNKHSTSRSQSGVPKSKHQSKDPRSSDGTQSSGKTGLSQKLSEHNQRVEGGSRISNDQTSSSSSIVSGENASSFQPATIPKHRSAPAEVNFPKEGLGFMLARNRSTTSPSRPADRSNNRRHSYDSLGPKGANWWSALNMWGRRAYSDPLHYAQGKTKSLGETPLDIEVLGLSSPQDLACLYQHWGFVTPRTDSQGEVTCHQLTVC